MVTETSGRNVQFVTIKDSTHMDQGDLCMYGQWEATLMNSMMFKASPTKHEGTPIEFHEFLCCIWLEYLLKIGYHDNTFTMSNIANRLRQFSSRIEYDKQMESGPISTSNMATNMDTSNAMDNSRANMV